MSSLTSTASQSRDRRRARVDLIVPPLIRSACGKSRSLLLRRTSSTRGAATFRSCAPITVAPGKKSSAYKHALGGRMSVIDGYLTNTHVGSTSSQMASSGVSDIVRAALETKPQAIVFDADHFDDDAHVARPVLRGEVISILHFAAKADNFTSEDEASNKWKAYGVVEVDGVEREWHVVFTVLADGRIYVITAHDAVRGAS